MAWKNRKVNPVSPSDFFELNSGRFSYEDFAEETYLMVHTYYLRFTGKIKSEMGKTWEKKFGLYMTDETFEYMLVNEPIMLRDSRITDIKQKQKIISNKYLEKSVVSFEFDLWLIENLRAGNNLRLTDFEKFFIEKYGSFAKDKIKTFKKFDLMYISNYTNLAKELDHYYDSILEIFNSMVAINQAKINFDKENTSRTAFSTARPVSLMSDTTGNTEVVKTEVSIKSDNLPDESPTFDIDLEQIKCDVRKELDKEYRLIIKEKDDRIERLENDIREFKRQRDEAREYSSNQYDRGVKDLFAALNDARYGKVIDYLFGLLKSDDADENLLSYIDNLFMALEDMEIEPIISEEPISVNEETMLKEFNLDFDKSTFVESRVRLKYAGWSYKDITMEKPTITMAEE